MTYHAITTLYKMYKVYQERKKRNVPAEHILNFSTITHLQKRLFPKYSINTMTEICNELKNEGYISFIKSFSTIEKISLTYEGITYCQKLPQKFILQSLKTISALPRK